MKQMKVLDLSLTFSCRIAPLMRISALALRKVNPSQRARVIALQETLLPLMREHCWS